MGDLPQPLAEAIGGSLAATLSVAAFYPLEVLRVHLQTQGTLTRGDADIDIEDENNLSVRERWEKYLRVWRKVVFNKGAGLRLVHTQVTAFLFYGLYKQINKTWFSKNKGAWANALSSTSAAMLTVLLVGTPLDGIILRLQTQTQQTPAHLVAQESLPLHRQVLQLYKGVTPALLLCLNPAIHFTVYDYLKLSVLNAARAGSLSNLSNSKQSFVTYSDLHRHRLTAVQAFAVGAAAKALATIVCYPLLRAKVDMMTATGPGQAAAPTTTTTQNTDTRSLWAVVTNSDLGRLLRTLLLVLRVQGIEGLYRGLLVHLVHTTLRSSLSMSIKEILVPWIATLSNL